MNTGAFETDIAGEALRLGFAAAGFAEAGNAPGSEVFERWLDQGYAADMDYLHRHAPIRCHPSNITPDVRSLIAVAARYPVNPHPGHGFCMTAQALDYHDIVRHKLRALVAYINTKHPLKTARICIDSAPLPEREWAQRAGIGWQGRQGQLISPIAGACTVLGFILTELPLQPSTPLDNRCGDCRLCVTSCPSCAILPDSRQIDSRRCLSYLTIEHDGDIPETFRQAIGQTLFGCDICTTVCPWNQTATAPIMPELCPRPTPLPTAGEILSFSPESFTERFRDTVVKRSGNERLQRNARIVQMNSR